jgi:hypothetical protein
MAADVKWSWERAVGLSPLIVDVLKSKNPTGPLLDS